LIGAPRYAPDPVRMAVEHAQTAAGLQVPQAYGPIPGAGECLGVIGTPCHAIYVVIVAFEYMQAAARLQVPNPHGSVVGAREGEALIGAPRNGEDAGSVAFRRS